MRTVAVIPARGGSKGVPRKNLRLVGGRSLIERAVSACTEADLVDAVFVTTDDSAIAAAARRAGAQVIDRPGGLAGDAATSESALLHALEWLEARGSVFDVLLFVQCTSPFISPADLDSAVAKVISGSADTVLAGVETFEFLWRDVDPALSPGTGCVVGQNHDQTSRPRRQDRRPDFRETGAFYAMRTDGFRQHRHRFFGRIGIVPVQQLGSVEIDTADELALADAVAPLADAIAAPADSSAAVAEASAVMVGGWAGEGWAIDVDAIVTDFDGVHTDDTAYVDEGGRETVRVSRSDGLGIGEIRRSGVGFLILSKERNPVVTARAEKLGVAVLQGVDDKATALLGWLAARGVDPARTAYVGNDVNDLGALAVVGWPIAVPDAHPRVLAAARVVLERPGGRGAVRELCQRVLAAVEQAPAGPASSVVPLLSDVH
ncbi:N-acylneuraminate cytidylyltransferase [Microlunatus panaciterrae]|uniref:N-acylneuraminate cytidylyltransferase n=1 Tax=Microlunatus panaciterrae TaxID=400768 RepID=A0ABS2RF85_9ACTN|nr:acylneuraminate cytidylyltransferase [Microlunatus panaciterrae]MBM7797358.1 N-acylneuraminate cytidylyltransferase [Microlunatus panaciterrae]